MTKLQKVLDSLVGELSRWAAGDTFWPLLAEVFAVSNGQPAAHALQAQLRRGELSQLARFEVVSGALLGPARSAYASSTNTIYVSERFLAQATSAQLQAVLLEEIGHAIDARVNLNDRPGDEGELFSRLVRGLAPTAGERQRLAVEQDQRRITIGDASLVVEQSLPLVYETKAFSLDGSPIADESGSYVYATNFDLDGANAAWVTSKGANQLLRFLDGDSVAVIANSVYGSIGSVDVDGGAVAYAKGNGRGTDVFQYRDGVTTKITERSGFYRDVQMDVNTIVWQGSSEASGGVADIYRYDGGTIRRVTNNAVAEEDVQLSGSRLVWAAVGGRDAGDDHEIYLDDGRVTRQLTANAWDDYSPVVSGNRVAWYQWKDNQENLFFFNGTTSRQVTTNADVDHPLIAGTNLVFQQKLANGSVALKFYNATTRVTKTLSSMLSSDDVQVSGNLVAWVEDGDLKLFNGSATRTIVDNLFSESGGYYYSSSSRFALRGNEIVAVQRPAADYSTDGELYLYDVTNLAAGATQLTTGADVYSFSDLGIAGDRILWKDGSTINLTQPSTKPILSFASPDYTVVEGFASPQNATLAVTLSSASREPVTVRYEAYTNWSDENAASGGSDYSAVSGILTFAAGVTSQAINVPILNDVWLEEDKVFHVRLSAPSNAVLVPGQNTASVTISDTWQVTGANGDSFTLPAGVENLTLTGTTDINGTGNASRNVIRGNSGNNRLDGGGGFDELIGGLGDDTYVIGSGDLFATIAEQNGQGTDTVEYFATGNFSYALDDNFENLVLTGSNRWADGNGLDNIITGNSSDNAIDGKAGSDTASYAPAPAPVSINLGSGSATGWGMDSLFNIENAVGSAFADALVGSASANVLRGGPGKDVLTGDGAGDRFDYRVLTDSRLSDASVDRIADFNGSAGDRFLVSVARAAFLNAGQVSPGVSDSDLTSAAIAARLTVAAFQPHFAAGFQMGSGPGMRSFVAINDAVAGYDAARDAVIEVTGLSGALSVSSFVTS